MPQSKKEKYRQQQIHRVHNAEHPKKPTGAIGVVVFLFILIGLGIAYFAAGANYIWLAAGAILGAIGGYLFAKQVVKGLTKK